jgi:hypothetical protein
MTSSYLSLGCHVTQHYAGSLCALVMLDHLTVTQTLNVFLEAQKSLVLSLFDTTSLNTSSKALPLGTPLPHESLA